MPKAASTIESAFVLLRDTRRLLEKVI